MMLTLWQQQCMKMQRQATPPNYATFFCLLYKVLYNLCLGFHGFIHQTAWRVDSKRGGGQRVDNRQVGLGPWASAARTKASEHVMCTPPTELPWRPQCCFFKWYFLDLTAETRITNSRNTVIITGEESRCFGLGAADLETLWILRFP